MVEHDPIADDSSHYEISLTTGQAFLAFVLLLLSLAAAFAFGMMIGRNRAEDRLVVRRDTPVIQEQSELGEGGRIMELGVSEPEEDEVTESVSTGTAPEPTIVEDVARNDAEPPATGPAAEVPHIAQLLSTREAAPAETLAARLIEAGFTSAFVERVQTPQGLIYRVRVRFPSEQAARAARDDLSGYTAEEVWIHRE